MMRYGMDQSKLKARCESRKAAEAVLELISESVEGDVDHFWKIIRDYASKQLPSLSDDKGPMTDDEADKFGRTRMPYGKFADHIIELIPIHYLDWLVGE